MGTYPSLHRINLAGIFVAGLFLAGAAFAQSRESGPWWPSAEWGPEDQAGASNRITPSKIIEAIELVTKGKIYELGQVFEADMPLFGNRRYSMVIPTRKPAIGNNRIVYHDEFLATQIGQVGTQFDGLGHVGQEIEMQDGSVEHVFYNGFTAGEMEEYEGLRKLGVEMVKPIVTRGVLVDIAAYKDLLRLPNSYEVTVEDLVGALRRQKMSEDDIQPGDAVFFRYGWSSLWDDTEAYNENPPGIGLAVARWIAGRQVTMIGSDSWTGEVIPNPDPNLAFPVHQELLMKNGIFNLENMQFDALVADGVNEFLFILTPIALKGATGSPARPIAIR
jgi:kynurenine formamidase